MLSGTRSTKILVVEDEAIVARDIDLLLRELGYDSAGCTGSAEQAVVLSRDLRPNLVLMDVQLSGTMDGITAAQIIRNELSIPVVFLTAFADDLTLDRAKASEPFGYILKPFSGRELRATIETAMYKHKADSKLQASRARLAILARHLMSAQEAERRRIARELHDEIGQVFTTVSLHLQLLKCRIPDSYSVLIDESLQIVGKAIGQVREMSLNMRPLMLDDFGLVTTMRWFIERQQNRSDLEIHFDAKVTGLELSSDSQITLYRVLQEAITNIHRHARAKHAWIVYEESDVGVRLSVRDDGCGFDIIANEQRIAQGDCLGLLGIRERVELLNGECEISSKTGMGTTICVFLPSQLDAAER